MGLKTKFMRAIAPRRTCSKCWATAAVNSKFCPECGAKYAPEAAADAPATMIVPTVEALFHDTSEDNADRPPRMVRCKNCSESSPEGSRYCSSCGQAMEAPRGSGQTAMMGGFDLTVGSKRLRLAVLNADGTLRRAWPVTTETVLIGKTEGDVVLGNDPYLSPRHARLQKRGDEWTLADLATLNGIYRRAGDSVTLDPGDYVRAGRQLFRVAEYAELFDMAPPPLPIPGVEFLASPESKVDLYLAQILGASRLGHVVSLDPQRPRVVGREAGDLVFPSDSFLSGRHAQFELRDGRCVVTDLKSTNGIYVRLRESTPVGVGDLLCFGETLVRFEEA